MQDLDDLDRFSCDGFEDSFSSDVPLSQIFLCHLEPEEMVSEHLEMVSSQHKTYENDSQINSSSHQNIEKQMTNQDHLYSSEAPKQAHNGSNTLSLLAPST